MKNRNKIDIKHLQKQTLKKIYEILVKFLGEPPKEFKWIFSVNEDDEPLTKMIPKITPEKFSKVVSTDFIKDFVVLTNIPSPDMKYYTKYTMKYTNNVAEGEPFTFFNVPVEDLAIYASKSILSEIPVWFAADVMKNFNWYHSVLDDELNSEEKAFGQLVFNKGERMMFGTVQGTHAMVLTGFNTDEKGKFINWQVENSWGYIDNETPGLDGFLNMSHSWFKKYVIQIVIHKDLFTRSFQKKLDKAETKELNPWDSVAPALRAGPSFPPNNYLANLAFFNNRPYRATYCIPK